MWGAGPVGMPSPWRAAAFGWWGSTSRAACSARRRPSHRRRPGAPVVLTALNGLRFLRHYGGDDIAAGTFDPQTLTERVCMEWQAEGSPRKVIVCEHGHRAGDLRGVFASAGFPA